MNPWVVGIVGLLIGMLPSVFYHKQLSLLHKKLQLAEQGKGRCERAYNEAQSELETKNKAIIEANRKNADLEAHYRSEIDCLEQSYQVQIRELQDKIQNITKVSQSAKPQHKVQNKPQQTAQKAYSVKDIQKTYARAYTPWTKEDDEGLKQRYNQGATINDLVKEFQRQPGGIRSRLTKLGLLS